VRWALGDALLCDGRADLGAQIQEATEPFVAEVQSGAFLAEEHCYPTNARREKAKLQVV
jgi:hypothetical protein